MISDNDKQHLTDEGNTHWQYLAIRFINGRCSGGQLYCLVNGCEWVIPKPQNHWYGKDLLNDRCLVCGVDRRKDN